LRFIGSLARDGHDVGCFDFRALERLAVDQFDERPQDEIDAHNKCRGKRGMAPIARAGKNADGA